MTTGWSSYRRPRLAAATWAVCVVESAWLLRRVARSRRVDELTARVETVTGAVGMLALAAATPFEDRTTSLNWMMPYSVAATLGLALNTRRVEGAADVGLLTAAYLATTVRGGLRSGQAVTALTNAASFGGFHAVAAVVVDRGRNEASQLDAARAESAAKGERLAAEQERNRQHRLLHDSAVQTLEAIANGLVSEPDAVQVQARAEARRLRNALAGHEDLGSLDEAMDDLARHFAVEGLEVDHTSAIGDDVAPMVLSAIVEATREALRNAHKHAEVRSVVVRCDSHDGGIRVTVRDHGVGFDPAQASAGFGIGQSIRARLGEVHGNATIWSEPGRGTRVTLWAPL